MKKIELDLLHITELCKVSLLEAKQQTNYLLWILLMMILNLFLLAANLVYFCLHP